MQDDNTQNQTNEQLTTLTEQVQSLTEALEGANNEIQNISSSYKRALADYQNLEVRTQNLIQKRSFDFKKRLFLSLLEVMDNIDLSSAFVSDPGLMLVKTQLQNILKNENVSEINLLGQVFDPEHSEVVDVVDSEQEADHVVEVIRKGYLLDGQVLRVAMVRVSSGKNPKVN